MNVYNIHTLPGRLNYEAHVQVTCLILSRIKIFFIKNTKIIKNMFFAKNDTFDFSVSIIIAFYCQKFSHIRIVIGIKITKMIDFYE